MNRKIAVAATGTATAAAVLTCGLTLTSNAATHPSPATKHNHKLHTKHYDARQVSLVPIDKLDQVATVDLTSRHISTAGKVQGAAVFTCRQRTPTSSAVNCHTAIALKGGILYGHAHLSFKTFALTGTITNGSGTYKGAHGSFSAVSDTKKHSIITLKYRL